MTWRDFYANTTGAFHVAGRFYSGPGHHGMDFAVGAHGSIPSYFTGTCVANGHSYALGNWTVFKMSNGKYAGFAHLLIGTRRNVGTRVHPGDSIGKAAGRGDDHGSAWTGPHCHTTVSPEIYGIYNGNTINPAPYITAARRASSTSTGTTTSGSHRTARVQAGEGGIAFASRVGISYTRLKELNPGVNMNALNVGQTLVIG